MKVKNRIISCLLFITMIVSMFSSIVVSNKKINAEKKWENGLLEEYWGLTRSDLIEYLETNKNKFCKD